MEKRADQQQALLLLYPALRTLPASQLAALCQAATPLQLPTSREVFAEGQTCKGFPLILHGTIKVVKISAGGREILLYRVPAGDSCVITSSCLLAGSPYSARGIAETPVSLLLLPIAVFEELVATSRPFRDFVFRLFAERIAELMQLVEEVAFHRLDQRLAKLLLARGDAIYCTHQALAEELGSVREIVSRLLKNFAAAGFVSLAREQIVVVDRAGLRQLADAGR
ncbi:Crp/Fnr family transcriptional regulator [Accumulibacter sp.]|uniref:Crp/Fnr family transcriptional regulator n=1 Tax=Accumulibacter sp. TaxID=2053492 RepID=UPI0025E5111E|nr:Crp/Fnr family transcriptional regulator [Accumulibacter sp.]MCM8613051.1 Crp/Fnr family transcriptional regulator [Accumulibacter sp.]MCM8636749.1 Crp/Fnr family transcriptional regulator [Accumulibacter sp.]MCM8640400.1 Crp/Fnr family transcriptional regulator [Accumulibacter sp.]